MTTVQDVFACLDEFAPVTMKLDFDNVGHLVGHKEAEVHRILVSLDITDAVIAEAKARGANLIVSHHPLLFSPVKTVTDGDRIGRKLLQLIESGIAAICMHTNMDAAAGGVNDALAAAVGLEHVEHLTPDSVDAQGNSYCIGRIGTLPAPMALPDFLGQLKTALNTAGLRYVDGGRPVHKVGVLGGSGGGELHYAIEQGCDTYITADVKYDVFLEAKELGINLIDGDHFCTENCVCPVMAGLLQKHFPAIPLTISQVHGQTVQFA